ncbi:MAG: DNA/RNA non-specific endonuclease [Clostridia bacterium]|nr:DNA/RNA non-specific endonuclease [Clostridia bacterium]
MSKNKRNNQLNANQVFKFIVIVLLFFALRYVNDYVIGSNNDYNTKNNIVSSNIDINNIPDYTNKSYIELNNNEPYFSEKDFTTDIFEIYSDLDSKGRCGVAYANICKELMPKNGETRGSINQVKPTGWEQTKVNGEYIYNRCHLIGYQLADENANEKNLITGTRYFNVEGMLPFENKVAEYINNNKKNHVLYRVTPVFKGDNLLASGVEMEAYSVEDNGKGLKYNVFIYNVQPGTNIDYSTGKVK